jgi:hypothetical protein
VKCARAVLFDRGAFAVIPTAWHATAEVRYAMRRRGAARCNIMLPRKGLCFLNNIEKVRNFRGFAALGPGTDWSFFPLVL